MCSTGVRLLTGTIEALDRMLGNEEGWRDFKVKTNQQGAATTVYAAFDPGLKGKYFFQETEF